MGMEKKTLFYYVISAVFMLACIWFLPKVMGIHSLIAGFSIVFGLTSVLNLILINKASRARPDYLKFILMGFLFLIPSTLLGFFAERLLINYLGNLLSLIIIGGVIVAFNFLLFAVFGLIDLNTFGKKMQEKRQE